ncbi:MAG: hypothetical protein WA624_07405, partial [Methylocella sp.]
DISALADESEEILLRILTDELRLISGGKLLRLERLEALVPRLGQALRAGIAFTATLGGAALRLQGNHTLVIVKEGPRGGAAKKTHKESSGRGLESEVRLT